jgi:chaperonin GroES
MFDESVSIDDPNRCFDWGGEDGRESRYVMFDVETVMGIISHRREAGRETTTIKMLGDRVLVRKPKREDFSITKTKLWVPAGNEKQEVGGVVIEHGPGVYSHEREKYLPMEFKKGDFVLFPKYGHTDIKIEGIDYAVLRQDKILAIVEGEAERLQFA